MIPHKSFLWCILAATTAMFGVQNTVEACRPPVTPPAKIQLGLVLEPKLDDPDNCLSVAKTWGEEDRTEGYGITLVSRCGKPIDVSVQDCPKCVVTTIEDGKPTDINRAEIEHEDQDGQLVFLWSDGERGGTITLMTSYLLPRRDGPSPCSPQNQALCTTNLTQTTTMPGELAVGLLAMVGFVGFCRKRKTFKQF